MLSRTCSRNVVVGFSLRRSLATEAKPQATGHPLENVGRVKKAVKPRISAAIILNRAPILTRATTPFELAYYSYQSRIRRSLHNPFPNDFYFKQGTLTETRFNIEERKRERLAFGPGFLEKEDISEEKRLANIAAVEQLAQQEGEGEELMPRTHAADIEENLKSLDRRGHRNLYLLLHSVEDGKDTWRFPQGEAEKGLFLHQAAQKDLHAECGDNMDSWIVGKAPVGVYKPENTQLNEASTESSEHVIFFFKAHIMAGQVTPKREDIKDFAWLTKEEIEGRLDKHYWDSVRDILSDY